MTLEQMIELLQAMKTEENKDFKIVFYAGIEMEASVVQEDGECVTIF